MFAMSSARRLISVGDPAPSQTTTSNLDRRSARQSSTCSRSGLQIPIGEGGDVADRATEHDDLAGVLAAGLEQHRVHRRLGLDASGRGLHDLRTADLGTVGADHRVVAHVLGLERGHGDAFAHEPSADAGGDHRLAGVRGGTGDQHGPTHANLPRLSSAAAERPNPATGRPRR